MSGCVNSSSATTPSGARRSPVQSKSRPVIGECHRSPRPFIVQLLVKPRVIVDDDVATTLPVMFAFSEGPKRSAPRRFVTGSQASRPASSECEQFTVAVTSPGTFGSVRLRRQFVSASPDAPPAKIRGAQPLLAPAHAGERCRVRAYPHDHRRLATRAGYPPLRKKSAGSSSTMRR